MNALQENLTRDIRVLLGKHKDQTLTLAEINVKIPQILSNVLAALGDPDFSISNSINSQKSYAVFIDGIRESCTKAQLEKLRKENDANMLLDMPRQSLILNLDCRNDELNFDELPFPSQKILEWGLSHPGELLNQDNSWSRFSLKSYIFTTRRLLEDNETKRIIKTSKNKTLPSGNYYFNPQLRYVVIKNPKSTFNQPPINKTELE